MSEIKVLYDKPKETDECPHCNYASMMYADRKEIFPGLWKYTCGFCHCETAAYEDIKDTPLEELEKALKEFDDFAFYNSIEEGGF